MRSTQQCPKCSGQKFAVTEEFKTPHCDSPFRLQSFHPIAVMTRNGNDWEGLGKFSAWICLGCGYTEFYARNLGNVVDLAQKYPDQLRIIDAEPPQRGPFR